METDKNSLSPLINSMRMFGLYFSRKPRINCEPTIQQIDQNTIRKCGDWNFARIHASVMLVITWLNVCRYAAIFDGQETLGAALFMKLGIIPAALLNVLFQTAYYIASHTGSLQRIIREVGFSMTEFAPKYGRWTKIATAVCWLLLAWNMFHYTYQLFTNGRLNDLTLIFLNRTLSESYLYAIKVVLVVLQLQTVGTWFFPQAMKFLQFCEVIDYSFKRVQCFVRVRLSSSDELRGYDFPAGQVPQIE